MPRAEVAVATHNPKTLYHVVALLEELGLQFVIRKPEDVDDETAKVVIGTKADMKDLIRLDKERLVILGDVFDSIETTIEVMMKFGGILTPDMITIGVDPGMRFGLVLTVNGLWVYGKTLSTPYRTVKSTLKVHSYMIKQFPECKIKVRVGTGSRLYSVLYIRTLTRYSSELEIELVDERNTTVAGESDQSSAFIISSRAGRKPLKSDYRIDPKEGYVRSLGHLVERVTDGNQTLSREEARAILLDETTLEDYLEEKR